MYLSACRCVTSDVVTHTYDRDVRTIANRSCKPFILPFLFALFFVICPEFELNVGRVWSLSSAVYRIKHCVFYLNTD